MSPKRHELLEGRSMCADVSPPATHGGETMETICKLKVRYSSDRINTATTVGPIKQKSQDEQTSSSKKSEVVAQPWVATTNMDESTSFDSHVSNKPIEQ